MKKKIFAIAVAMMTLAGISASAQQTCENCPQTPGGNNKMYQPREFTDFAFEGILLDVDQQARMDALRDNFRGGPAAVRPDGKQKAKPQICDKDSACTRVQGMGVGHGQRRKVQRGGNPANMLMPGVMYVAKVKEILTPEQFEVFMANVSNMPCPGEMGCPMGAQQRQMAPGQGHKCKKGEAGCTGDKKDCKKADCKKDCKKADCKKNCTNAECKKADCKDCKCDKSQCPEGKKCDKGQCPKDKQKKDKKSKK